MSHLSTQEHIWLLRKLVFLGLFLLVLTATITFQIFGGI